MEHYSVHLDQYISLTSSSSGNFLTPLEHLLRGCAAEGARPCWSCQQCWGRGRFAFSFWQRQAGEPGAKLGCIFTRTRQILPMVFPCSQCHRAAQPTQVHLSKLRGPVLTPRTSHSAVFWGSLQTEAGAWWPRGGLVTRCTSSVPSDPFCFIPEHFCYPADPQHLRAAGRCAPNQIPQLLPALVPPSWVSHR